MALFYLTALAVFLLDQGSKWLIQRHFALYQTVPVVPGLFSLTYVMNPGAAFGLFRCQTPFLVVLTFAVLVAVFLYRKEIRRQPFLFRFGLALGLGGAVGNLWDRLRFGAVIDFIELPHYPVFNIADSAIVVGVVLIVAATLSGEIRAHKRERRNIQ